MVIVIRSGVCLPSCWLHSCEQCDRSSGFLKVLGEKNMLQKYPKRIVTFGLFWKHHVSGKNCVSNILGILMKNWTSFLVHHLVTLPEKHKSFFIVGFPIFAANIWRNYFLSRIKCKLKCFTVTATHQYNDLLFYSVLIAQFFFFFFLKIGQTRPLFCLFSFFSHIT